MSLPSATASKKFDSPKRAKIAGVFLLDEPTAALDPRARRQVIELLRGFDHTMIVATHDMDMIGELCPRTIVMARGRIVADGPTRQVFADRAEVESWGLEPPRNR